MNKLPITAVLASCNEGDLLSNCIKSLSFCEHVMVFDLESTDNTKEVVLENNATYIWHKRVPVIEQLHVELKEYVNSEWVILIDPDEVVSKQLQKSIEENFTNYQLTPNLGMVYVPWLFYFKRKKLNGTNWGGVRHRPFIFKLENMEFYPEVHLGKKLKLNCSSILMDYENNNTLNHFWMNSYSKLIDKHKRYLKNEGESMYNNGKRTSFKSNFINFVMTFKNLFLTSKSYKDGLNGVFLGFFWLWYNTRRNQELLRFQKSHK